MKHKVILKSLSIAILAAALAACGSPEERKAKYKEEGKQYLQAGKVEKAGIAFKNVIQMDPKDWDTHYWIGEVLSKQGKIEPAFREYTTVVAQDQTHVMARVRVGQLLLLNHNFEEANKMADEALALEPTNLEALVLKAGIQTAENKIQEAFASVESALKISPNEVPALMMLASINVKNNNMDKAFEIINSAIEKNPDNLPLRTMLISLYRRTNQPEQIEKAMSDIINLQPKELQQYKNLAMFQAGQNQLDRAEATLRDAVQKNPDNEDAKTLLVDFLMEKRSPDIAIAELMPMIEKKPEAYELRFKLFNVQMAKKDTAAGEATLKKIIEMDKIGPSGINARDKLATLYSLTKRPNEAKELIAQVLEANPRDSDALTLRGKYNLAENKIPEAIADFRSVLVDQPNNADVLKMLANAHLRNNEEPLARENLEKAVAAAPKDETARLELAGMQLKAGQKDLVKQQLETLLKINPKSLKGLEAMFKFQVSEKQWEKAQEAAKQVQLNFPDDPTGFYMSGLGYQAENKLDLAAEAFQKAYDHKPDAIEPLNELIKTLMAAKQPAKALAKLQQVIKQRPDNIIAYNLMGGVYINEQKFSDAKTAFHKVEELKPEWFAPYRSLAMIELAQKNKPEAINVLKNGLEKSKGALELVADLASLYQSEGEHDKVLALYEESYKQHPQSVMAVNNLASYLSDFAATPENLERAAKIAEPLLKFNNPSLVDTVGWIAYKRGDYAKAKELLQRVLELDPNSGVGNYHLGMVFYKQNDTGQALMHLQKAVEAKSNFVGLEEAKQTLKTLGG